jgi:uncharacterized membrane protein YagU involved in acid resistance
MLRHGAFVGMPAGLVGGLVFGAAMIELGDVLPTIAGIVRADSPVVGFLVHMAIAAVIGAGFGLLVVHQRPGTGETLFWGLTYGALWWFVGPLTLLPLFLGEPVAWELEAAQEQFPSLPGHLLYGVTTGLAFVLLTGRDSLRITRGALVRGGLVGVGAAWLLGAALERQNELIAVSAMMSEHSQGVARLGTLALGLLAGFGFAFLYPETGDGAGPAMIRGIVFGFLVWVLAGLTLLPLLDGDGLSWSLGAARADFETLPGYVLFGAVLGLGYHALSRLIRSLFSDDVRRLAHEGAGTEGLQAVGRGALAGLVGGLLFTLIMVQIDFLPTVARLVGSDSKLTGFVVHLLIADLIGASYGLLFRRRSFDAGSALGWGVAYGFCWWILGALTLLPVFLGGSPQWSAAAAVEAFPALVGHLLYGAGLGLTFYALEARYSPWWVSRTQAEAARRAGRREQVLTSAPALWALVVVIALTVPILLGQ